MSKVVQLGRYAAVVQWTASEIKARRVAKGWTQQQLADAVFEVSARGTRGTVINWELGKSKPHDRWDGILDQVLGDVDPESPPADDPPLSQATFPQVMNRLVDLYNDVARSSIDRILRVEDAPLPPGFAHDHDVVEGPAVEDQPGGAGEADDTASQSGQRLNE